MIPHLEAEYAAPYSVPCLPCVDVVTMMRPPPMPPMLLMMCGAKARIAFAVPVRLTSIWTRQCASSISSSG